jgi:hypothetical protein
MSNCHARSREKKEEKHNGPVSWLFSTNGERSAKQIPLFSEICPAE